MTLKRVLILVKKKGEDQIELVIGVIFVVSEDIIWVQVHYSHEIGRKTKRAIKERT